MIDVQARVATPSHVASGHIYHWYSHLTGDVVSGSDTLAHFVQGQIAAQAEATNPNPQAWAWLSIKGPSTLADLTLVCTQLLQLTKPHDLVARMLKGCRLTDWPRPDGLAVLVLDMPNPFYFYLAEATANDLLLKKRRIIQQQRLASEYHLKHAIAASDLAVRMTVPIYVLARPGLAISVAAQPTDFLDDTINRLRRCYSSVLAWQLGPALAAALLARHYDAIVRQFELENDVLHDFLINCDKWGADQAASGQSFIETHRDFGVIWKLNSLLKRVDSLRLVLRAFSAAIRQFSLNIQETFDDKDCCVLTENLEGHGNEGLKRDQLGRHFLCGDSSLDDNSDWDCFEEILESPKARSAVVEGPRRRRPSLREGGPCAGDLALESLLAARLDRLSKDLPVMHASFAAIINWKQLESGLEFSKLLHHLSLVLFAGIPAQVIIGFMSINCNFPFFKHHSLASHFQHHLHHHRPSLLTAIKAKLGPSSKGYLTSWHQFIFMLLAYLLILIISAFISSRHFK